MYARKSTKKKNKIKNNNKRKKKEREKSFEVHTFILVGSQQLNLGSDVLIAVSVPPVHICNSLCLSCLFLDLHLL